LYHKVYTAPCLYYYNKEAAHEESPVKGGSLTRRLLLLLMLSVVMAVLLAASGVAAAQVTTEPPSGTGPTGGDAPEDVGPTDRPPVGGVDDIVAVDGGVVGDAPSDQGTGKDVPGVAAKEDPDTISTDPVDDPDHHPVNKDPGTNDDPSTVENPKTGNTPMDEEASASGDVKAEVIPEGVTKTAPEKEDATSAPKTVSAPDEAWQTANSPSPMVHGCAYDYEYDEELDMCIPTLESFEFWSVVGGDEPWPDSAGGYVSLLGGYIEDGLLSAGFLSGLGGKATEDALVEFGKDGGPIGWGIQGVGYTAGFVGEVGGVLLEGAGEVAGIVHDGLGEAVDAIGDAAKDAWDTVSGWF
jgi:hypothetical protein